MSIVSKKELDAAIDELNEKICNPAIKKKDEKKAKKKVLEAAKLIEKGDKISKETMSVIKKLQGKKKKTEEKAPAKTKKSEKKSKKTGSTNASGKQTIQSFAVEGFKSGKFGNKSNEQVAELIREKFVSNTKAVGVAWYRKEAAK